MLKLRKYMSSVTIRDSAKALNIAPSTVSSCLNGNTAKRRISQKRIDEVRKKADEMGYIPNMLASRIFKRNHKKYFGIIIKHDTAMSSTQSILNYILSDFNNRNNCDYAILYASTDDLSETLKNGAGLGIRDFIILSYLRGDDLKQINFDKLPDINIYATNYYFDNSDYENKVISYKIGFARDEYYQKLKSFLEKSSYGPVTMVQALEKGQKIPDNPEDIYYQVSEIKNLFKFGYDSLAPEILKKIKSGRCRTLLLRNDSLAIGVMEYLLQHDVKIPEEVAIIGFNNEPFSAYAKIPLSSISLPMQENVKELIEYILRGEKLEKSVKKQPTLILRKTTPSTWDWSNFNEKILSED